MCSRDDVVQPRTCVVCGREYYGALGHDNCPGWKKQSVPEREHERPMDGTDQAQEPAKSG